MSKIEIWNATAHVVVLDGGEFLNPAHLASVDSSSEVIAALLLSGEVVQIGEAAEEVPTSPLSTVEEMVAKEAEVKTKVSKSKRNISEDTDESTEDEVQLASDSDGENKE